MSGIQTLLKAEKNAHEIVSEARQYRVQKLKAAKADAAKEIEAYKKKKEADLKKFEAEHSGENKTADADADKAVEVEIAEIKAAAKSKEDSVVDLLLSVVAKPTPEMHINA